MSVLSGGPRNPLSSPAVGLEAADDDDRFACEVQWLRGRYLCLAEAAEAVARQKRDALALHQTDLCKLHADKARHVDVVEQRQLPAVRLQHDLLQREAALFTRLAGVLRGPGDPRDLQREVQRELDGLRAVVQCHNVDQLLSSEDFVTAIRWPTEHPLVLAAARGLMLLLDADFVDLKDWRLFVTEAALTSLRHFDCDTVDLPLLLQLQPVVDFDVAKLRHVSSCFGMMGAWLQSVVFYATHAIPLRRCLEAARAGALPAAEEAAAACQRQAVVLADRLHSLEGALAALEAEHQAACETRKAEFEQQWAALETREAVLHTALRVARMAAEALLPHYALLLEDHSRGPARLWLWRRRRTACATPLTLQAVRTAMAGTAMGRGLTGGFCFLRHHQPVPEVLEDRTPLSACLLPALLPRTQRLAGWPPVSRVAETVFTTVPWEDLVPRLLLRRTEAPSARYWAACDLTLTPPTPPHPAAPANPPPPPPPSPPPLASVPSNPDTLGDACRPDDTSELTPAPQPETPWPNEPDVLGWTPLHAVIVQGEDSAASAAIASMVSQGARLLVPDWRGATPLHCAARHGKPKTAAALLAAAAAIPAPREAGALPDQPPGSTPPEPDACCPLCHKLPEPLRCRRPKDQPPGVFVALRAVDCAGRPPLHWALLGGRPPAAAEATAGLLLDHAACLGAVDFHGCSVLQLACAVASPALLRRLLTRGALQAVVAWQRREDRPPGGDHLVTQLLQTVIQRAEVEVATVLIDALLAEERREPLPLPRGAPPAAATGWGVAPAPPCTSLLDVSFHAGRGGPIQLACQLGHVPMVELLLRFGFHPTLYQGYQQLFAVEEAVVSAPTAIVFALLADARVLRRGRTDNTHRPPEPRPEPLRGGPTAQWLYEGLRVNVPNDAGRPLRLLHLAIEHDRLQVVRRLLELRTFAGFVAKYRYTVDNQQRSTARKASVWWANALAVAIAHGRPAALRLVAATYPTMLHTPCLYRKAQSVLAVSPLLFALHGAQRPVVEELLRCGATPEAPPALLHYVPVLQSVQYRPTLPPTPVESCPPVALSTSPPESSLGEPSPPASPSAGVRRGPRPGFLADDVLTTAFTFLPAPALATAAAVCRRWHALASANALWLALGRLTLHGFRRYTDAWAAGNVPADSDTEVPRDLLADSEREGPVPGVRCYRNLYAYFCLSHPEGRSWNYLYRYATSPALLLEPRLGRAVSGYVAYEGGGLLGAEFLVDHPPRDGPSPRLWEELPLHTGAGDRFELLRRRLDIVESVLLPHPSCAAEANRLAVLDGGGRVAGEERLVVASPLLLLLRCPGRTEVAVQRLLDMKADPLRGLGVREGPAHATLALPLPAAKQTFQAADPFLRCPEEPPGSAWALGADQCYRLPGVAGTSFRWEVWPFEAALEWGNGPVFQRLFEPAYAALAARAEADGPPDCAALLMRAAQRRHTVVFSFLLDFLAGRGGVSRGVLETTLLEAARHNAADIVPLCLARLASPLPPPLATKVLAAAVRLACGDLFFALYGKLAELLSVPQLQHLIQLCCLYGRQRRARALLQDLDSSPIDTGPLITAAALGHVEIIALWIEKYGLDDLWRAGEAGPPADAAEDAGPPEDPPEAADPSAARWTPLFGLPMLFAGLAAAPGPGGPLAPVHCLATVKVRWAVAMLIEAALVAHGESSPAEAEQPLAVFPPLAWPVAHPSASPFLPPLLRAVAGQPLPRDVKAAFTLTAMSERPAWLRQTPRAAVLLVPLTGGRHPVWVVGMVLLPRVPTPPSPAPSWPAAVEDGPIAVSSEATPGDGTPGQPSPTEPEAGEASDAGEEVTFLDGRWGPEMSVHLQGRVTPDEVEDMAGSDASACVSEPSSTSSSWAGEALGEDDDEGDLSFLLRWLSTGPHHSPLHGRVRVLVLPSFACQTKARPDEATGDPSPGSEACRTGPKIIAEVQRMQRSSEVDPMMQAALTAGHSEAVVFQGMDGDVVGFWDGRRLLKGSEVLILRSAVAISTDRLANEDLQAIVTQLHYDMGHLCRLVSHPRHPRPAATPGSR